MLSRFAVATEFAYWHRKEQQKGVSEQLDLLLRQVLHFVTWVCGVSLILDFDNLQTLELGNMSFYKAEQVKLERLISLAILH